MRKKILFACTQNVVRSMMAEFLFYKNFPNSDKIVCSCGIRKGIIDGYALVVMREFNLETENHLVKIFEDFNPESFDLVISFSKSASEKALSWSDGLCENLYFPVLAPHIYEFSRDETLASYRAVREEIGKVLKKLF